MLVQPLLGACRGGEQATPPELLMASSERLSTILEAEVENDERRGIALDLVDSFYTVEREFAADVAAAQERSAALNATYETPRASFEQEIAALAKRRARFASDYVDAVLELRAALEGDEWARVVEHMHAEEGRWIEALGE